MNAQKGKAHIPKTPVSIKKRTAEASSSSSKRTKTDNKRPENYASVDLPRVELKPFRGSVLNEENLNSMDEDIQVLEEPATFGSSNVLGNYNPNQSAGGSSRVELKPFRGSVLDNEHLIPMDDDIQVLERPAPKTDEMINRPIKTEDSSIIIPKQQAQVVPEVVPAPIKKEPMGRGTETSQIKFLEAIQSLVRILNMPSSPMLHAQIREKVLESTNKMISNQEMVLAMEMLITKIVNHSVSGLSDTVDSLPLSHFLCYLKATILILKLEGLDSLSEKIDGIIKEAASRDKNIPVEKVASVLQHTLYGIGI